MFNFTKIDLLTFFSEIKTSIIPNGQAFLDFRSLSLFIRTLIRKNKVCLFFLVLCTIGILHLLIALMENEVSWGRTVKELPKPKER